MRLYALLLLATPLCGQTPKVLAPYQPSYSELQAYLQLTPNQMAELRRIHQNRTQAIQTAYAQITAKQKMLNDLIASGSADPLAVGTLTLEIQKMRTRSIAPTREREQALAVLTEEQKQKTALLEQALRMRQAADQAAGLDLIDLPPARVAVLEAASAK